MKINIISQKKPKGWAEYILEDTLLLLKNGCSSTQVVHKTIFPVTRIETISDGSINYNKIGYVENIDQSYKIQKGDLLLSNINSIKHIGKVAYYEGGQELYHGMNLLLLRFNNLIDKKFGYYTLISKKKWFEDHASKAINQASINQTILNKMPLIVPKNIEEQKKIAEILTIVDEDIKKNNKLILKTEKLKKGLMNELFTKGIRHKKFKKTKIGEVPVEWEVKQLSFGLKFYGGFAFKSENSSESGVRWLKIANVDFGNIDWTTKSYLPESFMETQKEFILKEKDLIMAMTRPILNNKLKIAVVKKEDTPCLMNQRVGRFVCNENLSLDFLHHFCNYEYFINELESKMRGSEPPNISSRQIEEIYFPFPEIKEQKKIADILSSIDSKIEVSKKIREKLTQLKKGLMSDLLSGKVRVNI